ncbi:MAG: hypothetical protein KDA99_23520, partial [Planctomycetales bacterium]|nr:hypothetical protein [Planctomycetales bacterium]
MLRDFFFRRRRKLRSSTSVARRRKLGMTPLATEQLEDRALLTATPLAAQFIVNQTIFGSQDVSEVETAIGITPDGEYVVAFHGNGVGETDGIFARRYDADGNALADAAKVNTYTSGSQSQPTIGVASDGSYLIAWSGRGAGDRQGIFAQKFSSDATASGSPMLVNTTVGGDQEHPDVAVTPAGAAVVVWNGNGTGDFAGIFGQLISAAGAKVGTEFRVNTTTTNEQNYPVVAIDDTGRFVVAWSSRHQDGDDWGIFAQRFAADGTALGAEFQVNTTTTSSQTEPAIAMAADGQFV